MSEIDDLRRNADINLKTAIYLTEENKVLRAQKEILKTSHRQYDAQLETRHRQVRDFRDTLELKYSQDITDLKKTISRLEKDNSKLEVKVKSLESRKRSLYKENKLLSNIINTDIAERKKKEVIRKKLWMLSSIISSNPVYRCEA